jgi:nicotinamidase-related amidase
MSRPLPDLDPRTSALVLIDLQRAIVGIPTQPHPAAEVVHNALRLASAARERGVLVVLVHVSFAADGADTVHADIEQPSAVQRSPGWDEIVPELLPLADVVVAKRQWGAFYGTDLDLQLRRRGRRTIVLGGIATNFGVESTARGAHERSYQLILVEDAMSAYTADDHAFAVGRIFPRLGRLADTAGVLAAWREEDAGGQGTTS